MSHTFEWPIFKLRPDGVLIYSDNKVPLDIAQDGSTPLFSNTDEAEAYLVDRDIRGSVMS